MACDRSTGYSVVPAVVSAAPMADLSLILSPVIPSRYFIRLNYLTVGLPSALKVSCQQPEVLSVDFQHQSAEKKKVKAL